jgi:hypothetical protein
MGEMRNSYKILVGKPKGKRKLGRPRCRWKDIKSDVEETQYVGMDLIHVAQDRTSGEVL